MMRRHTKYNNKTLSCHKIKPMTAICFLLLGLILISEQTFVSSESMYGPGLPAYLYSHPFIRLQQDPNWNSGGGMVLQDRNGGGGGGGVQSHHDLEGSGESENVDLQGESSNPSKRGVESINGGASSNTFASPDMQVNRNPFTRLGLGVEKDQIGQNPSLEMQHWQHQRILPPKGILLPKQFLQTTKTFNQPNGMYIGESSSEPDRNARGLLNTFNDYEVQPRQNIGKMRPSQFLLVGNPLNTKRNSLTGREGYMCHFKLCQLGASGKRRWSPVFEYD